MCPDLLQKIPCGIFQNTYPIEICWLLSNSKWIIFDKETGAISSSIPSFIEEGVSIMDERSLIDPELRVYGVRWAILSMFVLSGVANALVLLSWSPISDKASDYWGGIGATAVNLLAVSFQIMYIPGTALSAKTMKMYDLRTTMLLGGSLTTIGITPIHIIYTYILPHYAHLI